MGKDLNGKELGKGMSQRKDGRYSFRYVDRFGKRVQLYNNNLRQIKKDAKKILAENELLVNSKDGNITLNQLFELAATTTMPSKIKETTLIKYKDIYDRYVRNTLGSRKIRNISVQDLQLFLMSLNNYSVSTIKTIKSVLKHIYNTAVLFEYKQANPINTLYIQSNKKKKVVDSLTLDEQKLFEEEANNSYYGNLYMLILNTGLRVGEAIALELNDLDFENNIIHVRKQLLYNSLKGTFDNGSKYLFTEPKYDSSRDIPMNDKTINILHKQMKMLEYIKQNKYQSCNKRFEIIPEFSDLLFLSRIGTPISRATITNDLHQIVNIINSKHDVKMNCFGIHTLRHTFATRCYENKMDQKKLQIILGHKSIATTSDIYVTGYLDGSETKILDNI